MSVPNWYRLRLASMTFVFKSVEHGRQNSQIGGLITSRNVQLCRVEINQLTTYFQLLVLLRLVFFSFLARGEVCVCVAGGWL